MKTEKKNLDDWLGTVAEGSWQKLLTKQDLANLPPIGSQEGKGDEAIAYVHFFLDSWDWFAVEYNQKDEFYGLVKGFEEELGYFSLSELQGIKNSMGLGVERDMHFKPTPLSQLRGKDERLELVKSSDMDRLKTGFMGETEMKMGEMKAGMQKYKLCACGKPIERGQSIVKAVGKWVHDNPDCIAIAKGEKKPKAQEPVKEPVGVAESKKR
jgi:hypothetical protein